MNIYNAHMRLLPYLWFSMNLGVINSFLIVCFYNDFKSFQLGRIFTKFMQKHYVMAIKQHLWQNALNLQSIHEAILPIIVIFSRSCTPYWERLFVFQLIKCAKQTKSFIVFIGFLLLFTTIHYYTIHIQVKSTTSCPEYNTVT